MNNMVLYTQLVASAFAKRKYAERLLEEAEEDLVRAKELLEDKKHGQADKE